MARTVVFFDSWCIWLDNPMNAGAKHMTSDGMSNIVVSPHELTQKITRLKHNPNLRAELIDHQNSMIEGFDPWHEWQILKWLI